ncbi:MAG TPA: hypothetical protein VGL15_05280 [Vicinamibacteria bacterium]
MKQPAEGQWLSHERFGIGVATRSSETRTTIQFDEHGTKTFVTDMLQATPIAAPDRPAPPPRARRKTKPAA